MGYFLDHLAGRQGLRRAFWINGAGALITCLLTAIILAPIGASLDDVPRLMLGLGRDVLILLLSAWAMIGMWAAATRAAQSSTGRMAAAGVKLCVLLGTVAGLHFLISTVPGRITILNARINPSIADYLIARTAADEVTFSGALNDRATRELKDRLSLPGIKVLRITSHGGLIVPVMELAGIVADKKIAVTADGSCLSSCTLLLAASPNAIVTPSTRVTFHRPTPAVLGNATDATALALAIAKWHASFRDYGITASAVAEMSRRAVWTPGLKSLAEMGLIKFVLDGQPPKLTPAKPWCRTHHDACKGPKARSRTSPE